MTPHHVGGYQDDAADSWRSSIVLLYQYAMSAVAKPCPRLFVGLCDRWTVILSANRNLSFDMITKVTSIYFQLDLSTARWLYVLSRLIDSRLFPMTQIVASFGTLARIATHKNDRLITMQNNIYLKVTKMMSCRFKNAMFLYYTPWLTISCLECML